MLVYVASYLLDWLVRGPLARSEGLRLPRQPRLHRLTRSCRSSCRAAASTSGFDLRAGRRWPAAGSCSAARSPASRSRVLGQAPRAGAFAGFSRQRHGDARLPDLRRARRACRHLRGRRADRQARTSSSRPATASPRSSSPSSAGSIRSASWSPAWCWRSPISAARRRRSSLGMSEPDRRASSRACCCSSCSPATRFILYRIRFVRTPARPGREAAAE